MGIALYFGQALVEPFAHGSLLETLPALGVFVIAGIAIYALACFVTGAFRPADLKAILRRRPEIGRAHVWTPVTNAHLVCRLLLEKKKQKIHRNNHTHHNVYHLNTSH